MPLLESRDLDNQCQGALKLFWRLVVVQQLTETLYVVFSFNLQPSVESQLVLLIQQFLVNSKCIPMHKTSQEMM